jgi:hypothetical protein
LVFTAQGLNLLEDIVSTFITKAEELSHPTITDCLL